MKTGVMSMRRVMNPRGNRKLNFEIVAMIVAVIA